MMVVFRGILALGLVFSVVACSTAPGTILETVPVEKNAFVVTDSRQRVVTNSTVGTASRPGLVDPNRVICTEPSPDVAIAVANSFGVGASVLGQGSASISASQAQGIAQLAERTAAIQLLRDKMYQTCLAYSNGAISGTTYSLIMSRLDETIVSMLLGETAGGAFGRSLAGIGVGSEAEASASLLAGLSSGLEGVQGAAGELAAIDKEIEEKDDLLQAKREVVATKEPAGEEPTQADKDAVAKAEADLEDARRRRRAMMALLKDSAEATAKASAAVSELKAGGGLDRELNPEVAAVLGEMQKTFVDDDFSSSYISACLIDLSLQKSPATNDSVADQELFREFLELLKTDTAVGTKVKTQAFQAMSKLRSSALSSFCLKNLEADIDAARDARKEIQLKGIEVNAEAEEKIASAREHSAAQSRMAAFDKAVKTCETLGDPKKDQCLDALFAMK